MGFRLAARRAGRKPNGFNEQQAPRIPAEVYGHVFTAQEKANLQD